MDRTELLKKTVKDLRELAEQYPDVSGVSGKTKDELLEILAGKLGIDLHDHVAAGIGRHRLKARIRELKAARDQALAAGDREALAKVRGPLKHNRRALRKAITRSLTEAHKRGAAS